MLQWYIYIYANVIFRNDLQFLPKTIFLSPSCGWSQTPVYLYFVSTIYFPIKTWLQSFTAHVKVYFFFLLCRIKSRIKIWNIVCCQTIKYFINILYDYLWLVNIHQVRVWSRTHSNAQKFAQEIGAKVCSNAEEAVKNADIICTVTFSTTPILQAAWVKPGAHINGMFIYLFWHWVFGRCASPLVYFLYSYPIRLWNW